MKNLFCIVAFFITILFSSCNEDTLDVTFPTTISGDIPVTLNDGAVVYNNTTDLQLAGSIDDKYLDKLKSVVVTKLIYEIEDFTGDDKGKITGDLKADGLTLDSVTDEIVGSAFINRKIFEVTDTTALNNAGNALLYNHLLTLQTVGTSNYTGSMTFTVHITMELSIVANPLN